MEPQELLGVALRASIMYLFALAMMRLAGKRSIGQLSAIDFVIATAIGDMFDDVFWLDVPLAKGLVGFGTLVVLHAVIAVLDSRVPQLSALINGRPQRVIAMGKWDEGGLDAERVRRDEILAALRQNGISDPDELAEAFLEPSGQVGALHRPVRKPAEMRDRGQLEGALE